MICAACGQPTAAEPCAACGAAPRLRGEYALLEVLGRGTTGTTWLAARRDDTRVAIKELRTTSDAKQAELLAREIRVLRELHHPAIPAYLEDFATGAGRFSAHCLVQEHMAGRTLAALAASRRFGVDEVFELADHLLEPLAYLHGLSPPVVHRDLKPENIVVRPDGSVAIVDFGSVRDAWKGTFGGSTLTGTFGYMAPEQFAGDASPASDVYALGVLIVHLLSRRDPAELRDRNQRFDWRPHVSLPPRFEALLSAMLSPDPADRPPDAASLARAIASARRAPNVVEPAVNVLPAESPPALEKERPEVVDPFHRPPMVPPRDPLWSGTDLATASMSVLWMGLLAVLVVAIVGAAVVLGTAPPAVPPARAPPVELFGRTWTPQPDGWMALQPSGLRRHEYLRVRLEAEPMLQRCVPKGAIVAGTVSVGVDGSASFAPKTAGDPAGGCVAAAVAALGVGAPAEPQTFDLEVFGPIVDVDGMTIGFRHSQPEALKSGMNLSVEALDAPFTMSGPDLHLQLADSGKVHIPGRVPEGVYDFVVGTSPGESTNRGVPLFGSWCVVRIGSGASGVDVICQP